MKKMKMVRIVKLFLIICLLTTISFFFFFARNENGHGDNFLFNFLANSFYIFRFPTHVLFWKYMYENAFLYIAGLATNAVLYAVLIEFLISYFKRRNKKGVAEATP